MATRAEQFRSDEQRKAGAKKAPEAKARPSRKSTRVRAHRAKTPRPREGEARPRRLTIAGAAR
jgi:hypothetical protein